MNPGVSLQCTMVFPMALPQAVMASAVAGEVSGVFIIWEDIRHSSEEIYTLIRRRKQATEISKSILPTIQAFQQMWYSSKDIYKLMRERKRIESRSIQENSQQYKRASPRSTILTASNMKGTRRRLTMKPGVSLHSTVTLPMAFPQAVMALKVSPEVSGMRTT
ncbi:hypothetical protein E2C01_015149 [Portunus trituberculatus]|uniref:Uncharacterized protein n=1 Tax=Portunus trituberculatus TaxID=210409 RepID=A0A5B7DM19_PORTR|nr:hypothetical protein [Portunus trituberculatus]